MPDPSEASVPLAADMVSSDGVLQQRYFPYYPDLSDITQRNLTFLKAY